MTHDCPSCGEFVSGYHRCEADRDRVAFECLDCGETIDREAHHMDVSGLTPQRCAQCTLDAMAEGGR